MYDFPRGLAGSAEYDDGRAARPELIVETHQALVAGRLAIRFEIAALLIEVAPDERLPCDTGERVGFLYQPAQYPSTAFRGLVQQDGAMLPCTEALCGQFRFLDLEGLLAAALQEHCKVVASTGSFRSSARVKRTSSTFCVPCTARRTCSIRRGRGGVFPTGVADVSISPLSTSTRKPGCPVARQPWLIRSNVAAGA